MAAKKFLRNISGVITEIIATVISAGAGNAGDIPALDTTGRLDVSVMPVGIGAETISVVTTDNLPAGAQVNLYSLAGVAKVRLADASVAGKEANGFVLAAFTIGQTAIVYQPSQSNGQLTGRTAGAIQYLSDTTPGALTETCPTTSGHVVQILGKADSATSMVFNPQMPIVLA